jgi:hypothetical protein
LARHSSGAENSLDDAVERCLSRKVEDNRAIIARAKNMHNFLAKRFLFPRWEEMIAVVVSIAEKMERELKT